MADRRGEAAAGGSRRPPQSTQPQTKERDQKMAQYANPDVIVETDWIRAHLDDPHVKLVEIDVDTKAYETGHIPGAVGFNWQSQLQDQVQRDIITREVKRINLLIEK